MEAILAQGAVDIAESVSEFLMENSDEAVFCALGIFISVLTGYCFHRLGKRRFNPEDFFHTCKIGTDLVPEDFGIQKYDSYYLERNTDEKIYEAMARENARVLVVGRPMAGKTRAVFRVIEHYYYQPYIYMPFPKEMDITKIDSKKIESTSILFFDDIDNFTRKFSCYELFKKFKDSCNNLKVVVTYRTGQEESELRRDKELNDFMRTFERIELEDISLEEGKCIANNVRIDFKESMFDHTVGSVLLGLEAMIERFEKLEEEQKVLLRLVKILVEGRISSIEKSILKRLFHHWIHYENIHAHYSFDSCLKQLVSDSFLVIRKETVTYSYRPYLEIIGYDVLDTDLLELKNGFCDLKCVEGLVNVGYSFLDRGKYREGIECFSEAIKLDSKNEAAYFGRGWSYSKTGEYDKAVLNYSEVLNLHENAEAYYNRGLAYFQLGAYQEALYDFEKAFRLDAKNPDPRIVEPLLSLLMKPHYVQRAAAILGKMLESKISRKDDKTLAEIHEKASELYANQSFFSEAAEQLQKALSYYCKMKHDSKIEEIRFKMEKIEKGETIFTYCSFCNHKVFMDYHYCPNCGRKIR